MPAHSHDTAVLAVNSENKIGLLVGQLPDRFAHPESSLLINSESDG